MSAPLPMPESARDYLFQGNTAVVENTSLYTHTHRQGLSEKHIENGILPDEKGLLQKIQAHPAVEDEGDFNPQLWPRWKKTMSMVLIGMSTFLVPLATTAFLPALLTIESDLNTNANIINTSYVPYVLVVPPNRVPPSNEANSQLF